MKKGVLLILFPFSSDSQMPCAISERAFETIFTLSVALDIPLLNLLSEKKTST